MYKVALNVAISYYRTTQKRSGTVPFADSHGQVAEEPYPFEDADSPQYLLQKHVAALKDLIYRNCTLANSGRKWFRFLFQRHRMDAYSPGNGVSPGDQGVPRSLA
jgi:hypothetical protein